MKQLRWLAFPLTFTAVLSSCNQPVPVPSTGITTGTPTGTLNLALVDGSIRPTHVDLVACNSSTTISLDLSAWKTEIPAAAYCQIKVTANGQEYAAGSTIDIQNGQERTLNLEVQPDGIATRLELTAEEMDDAASTELTSQGTYRSFRGYDAARAAQYAMTYYATPYGAQNPFGNYESLGGNCTNFVNQALIAGLMQDGNTPTNTFVNRAMFYDESGSYLHYWKSDANRRPSWTGANQLRQYMVAQNSTSYSGINFRYVTNDSLTVSLNLAAIQVGDIVSVDWDNNGVYDHSAMVTGINTGASGYARILVTYQNASGYLPRLNKPLSELNSATTIFYVYRPLGYTP